MKLSSTTPSQPRVQGPARDHVLRLLVSILLVLTLTDRFFVKRPLPIPEMIIRREVVAPGNSSNSIAAHTTVIAPSPSPQPQSPPLNFITLIYADLTNRRSFEQNIAHNCRLIHESPVGHTLTVYTDLPYEPYCELCTCIKFVRRNCTCPAGNCNDGNSFCEKVHLFDDILNHTNEFVFMDRDFIIINQTFIERLYPRTRVHDFLISYDHTHYKNSNWRKPINNALFFLRKLPGLNYHQFVDDFYAIGSNSAQPVMEQMIFNNYTNYDFLSFQFHCRFITDIIKFPPELCLGFHDRGREPSMFKRMNFRMKMINGTLYDKYNAQNAFVALPFSPPPLPPK